MPTERVDVKTVGPNRRVWPIRRLTDAEADAVGYAGPLQVGRLQLKWVGPWWRNTKWYVVETVRREERLVVTKGELTALGVEL